MGAFAKESLGEPHEYTRMNMALGGPLCGLLLCSPGVHAWGGVVNLLFYLPLGLQSANGA